MNELMVAREINASGDASNPLRVASEVVPTTCSSSPPPIVHQVITPRNVIVWQPIPRVVDRALNNRVIVFAILLIAGPIGLPAMWLSRRFSRPTKVLTTLVYIVGTVLLPIAAVVYYLEFSLWPLVNAFPK